MVTVEDDADDERQPWSRPEVAAALEAADMPPHALALYARWWQLETWLRELAYVELRALLGTGWTDPIKVAANRQARDAAYTHMAGVDNDNPLAYLDYSQLIQVIAEHWDQFGYALFEQRAWEGRQVELTQIRHRIGHLRTPHRDDLGRLEQTLRDLERGTFIALASYNGRHGPNPDRYYDPVTAGWIGGTHPIADLLDHADRQYDTRFHLTASRRPWASWPDDLDGAPGVLWHATFYMSSRTVEPATLWHDSYVAAFRPLIVHMLADHPSHVEVTFSAVDDSTRVADAIGGVLQAVLHTSRPRRVNQDDLALAAQEDASWRARTKRVDYRVLTGTGWNIVDETTVPITNFGADGGVQSAPRW